MPGYSHESLALLALEVRERGQHVDRSAQRLRIGARVLLLEVRLQQPPFEAARADGIRLAVTVHRDCGVAVFTIMKQGRSLADGDQRISLGRFFPACGLPTPLRSRGLLLGLACVPDAVFALAYLLVPIANADTAFFSLVPKPSQATESPIDRIAAASRYGASYTRAISLAGPLTSGS